MVFLLEVLFHVVHIVQEIAHALVGDIDDRRGFAGDGVAEVAALEVV